MRITKRALRQARQSVQIEHFLKVSDPVGGEVELTEGNKTVETDTYVVDVVSRQVKHLKALQIVQAGDLVDYVLVDPQFLKHDAFFKSGRARDTVVAKVQFSYASQLVKALDRVKVVVREPRFLEMLQTIQALQNKRQEIH